MNTKKVFVSLSLFIVLSVLSGCSLKDSETQNIDLQSSKEIPANVNDMSGGTVNGFKP